MSGGSSPGGNATRSVVRVLDQSATRGILQVGQRNLPCALGRSGIRHHKREGDGATPAGTWHLMRVLYRADRVRRPETVLPVLAIGPNDGWCDAVADRNYNRAVSHPYPASAERLWRDDHLYDLLVILDHNQRPRVRGLGSAIFMHLAHRDYRPTEGCIALCEGDLRRLLVWARPGLEVVVGGSP